MCGLSASLAGLNGLKLQTNFLTFKQPKYCIEKWRLWCCCYWQRLLLKRKWTFHRCHPTFQWRPHIIWTCTFRKHNQYRWWRGDRKISNGNGSLGHWHLLHLKWTWFNLFWQGCHHVMFSQFHVFDANCVALSAKQGLSQSKNKHK